MATETSVHFRVEKEVPRAREVWNLAAETAKTLERAREILERERRRNPVIRAWRIVRVETRRVSNVVEES